MNWILILIVILCIVLVFYQFSKYKIAQDKLNKTKLIKDVINAKPVKLDAFTTESKIAKSASNVLSIF